MGHGNLTSSAAADFQQSCERATLPARAGGVVFKLLLAISVAGLASCASPKKKKRSAPKIAHINTKTKFSSSAYGVKGSPRVTTSRKVKKGGGRYQVGKPYKIRGKWYKPKHEPGYNRVGMASWYGPNFHGRLTANGEVYDQYSLSAAHPTLPLPSYAKVTNLSNGSSVIVRINDRGPFSSKRIIDLSAQASKMLGYQKKGLTKVRVRYIGKARMDGLDARYLMASYKPAKGQRRPSGLPTYAPGATRPGTLLASATMPGLSGQKRPVIKQPVQAAFVSPERSIQPIYTAAFVPVPLLRPTPLNAGYSMDLVSNNAVYISTLEPLGFVITSRTENKRFNLRIARAFDAIEDNSR